MENHPTVNGIIERASLLLDGGGDPVVHLDIRWRDGTVPMDIDPASEPLKQVLSLFGPLDAMRGRPVRIVVDDGAVIGLADFIEDVAVRTAPETVDIMESEACIEPPIEDTEEVGECSAP